MAFFIEKEREIIEGKGRNIIKFILQYVTMRKILILRIVYEFVICGSRTDSTLEVQLKIVVGSS